MAWSEFYMQTTGSNLNAGSTTDDTSSVTTTNGGWDTTTRVFTAASGTPFSAVVAGEWVSIYLDAATKTTFIAQVESVGGGGASVTVSATNRLGTQPTTGATGRSCKVGGAWASFNVCTSSVFSAGTSGTPMRLNVKAATYANTTTSRTFAAAGTTTAPICIRGYNTTPGDLDNVADGTRPSVTFTSGQLSFNGTIYIVQNLNVETTQSAVVFASGGNDNKFLNCRFVNLWDNASGSVVNFSSSRHLLSKCYLGVTSASAVIATVASSGVVFNKIVFSGGSNGVSITAGIQSEAINCIFVSQSGNAIRISASTPSITVDGCTFYNSGGSAIESTAVVTSNYVSVTDCTFSAIGGYAINNSSGTNTARIFVGGNLYHNCTSGTVNGLGDVPDFGSITDSSDPFVDAANGDFSLKSTSTGYGVTRKFENIATTSYPDIGAVQALRTAGTAGARLVGASALITPGGCC